MLSVMVCSVMVLSRVMCSGLSCSLESCRIAGAIRICALTRKYMGASRRHTHSCVTYSYIYFFIIVV